MPKSVKTVFVEVGHSLAEHIPAVVKTWWTTVIGAAFALLGAVGVLSKSPKVPAWIQDHASLWWLLAGLALLVAQFVAFHRVRLQREQLAASLASLRDEIRHGFRRIGFEPGSGLGMKFLIPFENFSSISLKYEVHTVSFMVGIAGVTPISATNPPGAGSVVAPGQTDRFFFSAAQVDAARVPAEGAIATGILEIELQFGPAAGPNLYRMRERMSIECYLDPPDVAADTVKWRVNSYSVPGFPIVEEITP